MSVNDPRDPRTQRSLSSINTPTGHGSISGSAFNNPPDIEGEEQRYDLNGNPIPGRKSDSSLSNSMMVNEPQGVQQIPPAPQQPPFMPEQNYNPGPPPFAPPPYLPTGTPLGPPPFSPINAKPPKDRTGWYIAIGATFIGILFMVILAVTAKPSVLKAPQLFKSYTSPDNTFVCSGPDDPKWVIESAGVAGSDNAGILFQRDKIKIDINASMSASFMGDIVKTPGFMGGGYGENSPEKRVPAVEKMHVLLRGSVAKKYKDYSESPMEPIQTGMGDARISEWTGSGGVFVGPLKGYRVTILGTEREITVNCQCPYNNWSLMQPVFLKVIQSISPGKG